jgi:hypothetical protein
MNGLNYKWRVVLVLSVVSIITTVADERCACAELKDKPIITVRAQDIPQSVQILGLFGQPLGSLLTIRGKWIKPGILEKDPSLRFHVDLVNGKKPNESVDLHGLQVNSIFPQKGRKQKPGETWDWRFDPGDTDPPPTPVEGETWEMMGIEKGAFESYSAEAWKEVGAIPDQKPYFMKGFFTRFEFFAVKRITLSQSTTSPSSANSSTDQKVIDAVKDWAVKQGWASQNRVLFDIRTSEGWWFFVGPESKAHHVLIDPNTLHVLKWEPGE